MMVWNPAGSNGDAPVPVPPPPAPPPSPVGCPDGVCLFDVSADPHERTELSALHAEVVEQMARAVEPREPRGPDRHVRLIHSLTVSLVGAPAPQAKRMDGVLRTYTEYAIDPSCGPATFANDSHVGEAWQPWC